MVHEHASRQRVGFDAFDLRKLIKPLLDMLHSGKITLPPFDFAAIHRCAADVFVLAGRYGNGVLVASLINGRKTDALNLEYDPHTGSLSFAPPGVQLYLGP